MYIFYKRNVRFINFNRQMKIRIPWNHRFQLVQFRNASWKNEAKLQCLLLTFWFVKKESGSFVVYFSVEKNTSLPPSIDNIKTRKKHPQTQAQQLIKFLLAFRFVSLLVFNRINKIACDKMTRKQFLVYVFFFSLSLH